MSELGTKLRDARVEKGYTLNTLQQMTKIQKKYLQAIELGNYDEMPGSFYVRAFIKQYADMVGLDGDQLLLEYEDELSSNTASEESSSENDKQDIPSRTERHETKDNGLIESIMSYVPLFLLVAIIFGVIIALVIAINNVGQEDQPTESVQSEPTTSIVSVVEPDSVSENSTETASDTVESTEAEQTLGENDIRVGNQVLTLVSAPGETTTYQLNAPFSEYNFEIEGNAFVWVGIFEDGVIVQDTTVVEGETLEHTVSAGTQEVRISLGYPEGANISVNGTAIEPQGQYLTETIVFQVDDNSSDSVADETIELDIPEEGNEEDFQGPAVLDPANNMEGAE